jgi:hypothetical protein
MKLNFQSVRIQLSLRTAIQKVEFVNKFEAIIEYVIIVAMVNGLAWSDENRKKIAPPEPSQNYEEKIATTLQERPPSHYNHHSIQERPPSNLRTITIQPQYHHPS